MADIWLLPWAGSGEPMISTRDLTREAGSLKVGIVSDLHCNLQGLDLALEAMGDVDELLCLGDSIFEYQFSNDVVARLKERGAHIIQGNHEEVFLSPAGVRARERDGIDPALLEFLAAQPHRNISGARDKTAAADPFDAVGAARRVRASA